MTKRLDVLRFVKSVGPVPAIKIKAMLPYITTEDIKAIKKDRLLETGGMMVSPLARGIRTLQMLSVTEKGLLLIERADKKAKADDVQRSKEPWKPKAKETPTVTHGDGVPVLVAPRKYDWDPYVPPARFMECVRWPEQEE